MPAQPLPPWGAQRLPLSSNQPGNPLQGSGNLTHPAWNPGGLFPGPAVTSGPYAWCTTADQAFRTAGTSQVWVWQSPVFDLRPGVSAAFGFIPAAVPINHEAALGQSVYMGIILGNKTGTPPAVTVGLTTTYAEDGSGVEAGALTRLTKQIDVTSTVQAGGDNVTVTTIAPRGGSPFSISPCIPGLRFWQVTMTMTIPGLASITEPYFLSAWLH